MKHETERIVHSIADLPGDWHGAGTVGSKVLWAIARHAEDLGEIRHSAETGSGKTTLLLSHLSQDHTVFAMDAGESISRVRSSPLFNSTSTTFVEGPSQRTLPQHAFVEKQQLVLLDGPHGYPFPDLEYFYTYPHIDHRGLLIIDDIRIPSIGRMCDILKCDAMFDFVEVVDGNTAFFRRTDAPAIDPESDSWWLQGFNRAYHDEVAGPRSNSLLAKLIRVLNRRIPQRTKDAIPARLKQALRRYV